MRTAYEPGQKFLLDVQWKHFKTESECLYANPRDVPHPLTEAEAKKVIAGIDGKRQN